MSGYKQSWLTVSYYWNKFVANLRKRFGRVLTVRCYESSDKGYSHIHCILYFKNYSFPTFLKWSYKKNRYLWRISFQEVEKIKGYWHSFLDIQGMVNLSDGFNYLGKYISKSADLTAKAQKTLALTWAFHKRAYSLGNKFKKEIFRRYLSLDLTHISISQTFSTQMTLDSKDLKQTLPSFLKLDFEKIKLVGTIDKKEIKKLGGIPKDEWTFGLTQKQQEYALYRTKGVKPKTKNQSETFREYIKNPWKYIGAPDTTEYGRLKVHDGIEHRNESKTTNRDPCQSAS